ncbi:MAG: hypothetical protein QOJ51_693, partial [Acidobacteriaceae bacterium]|nr:hypothetical protein [Acidobacteriaceae bacterium]
MGDKDPGSFACSGGIGVGDKDPGSFVCSG